MGFTGLQWVLPSFFFHFCRFYWVAIVFRLVLPSFTDFFKSHPLLYVLLGCKGFYLVLPIIFSIFTGFNAILLGFPVPGQSLDC